MEEKSTYSYHHMVVSHEVMVTLLRAIHYYTFLLLPCFLIPSLSMTAHGVRFS